MVGASVVDVVMFAGGWLFDRAMAGWEVTVLLTDHPDDRPLRILGARTLDLEYALASADHWPRPRRWLLPLISAGVILESGRACCRPSTMALPKSRCGGQLAGRARGQRWPGAARAQCRCAGVQSPCPRGRRGPGGGRRRDGDFPKRGHGVIGGGRPRARRLTP
ncbi:hypothetical protein I552_2042 [Mycobacterium xenopi 3993]|nr:hypothetical protein I552_2042 [Mycobacterium xenopi 3993]